MFDRERRKPGVGDTRPGGLGLEAQTPEYGPMVRAGLNDAAVRLTKKFVAKSEPFLQRARGSGKAAIARDPNQRRKRKRRHAEGGLSFNNALKPRPRDAMVRRIRPESVDQDVDVGQKH